MWIPSKDSLYCTMLGWLILARTATSFRDSCLSLLDIWQSEERKTERMWKGGKGQFTLLVTREAGGILHMGAYSRYANLLDDKLVSILFWFNKDGLSKRTFSNFLHLFVLIHVTGMTGSSCWVCKEMKEHAADLCSDGLDFFIKLWNSCRCRTTYISPVIVNFGYHTCVSCCSNISVLAQSSCAVWQTKMCCTRRAVMLIDNISQLVASSLTPPLHSS